MSAWTAAARKSFEERWNLGPEWKRSMKEKEPAEAPKRRGRPRAEEQKREKRMTDILISREMMDGRYYLKNARMVRGEKVVTWTTVQEEARIFSTKAEAREWALENEIRPPYEAVSRKKASAE